MYCWSLFVYSALSSFRRKSKLLFSSYRRCFSPLAEINSFMNRQKCMSATTIFWFLGALVPWDLEWICSDSFGPFWCFCYLSKPLFSSFLLLSVTLTIFCQPGYPRNSDYPFVHLNACVERETVRVKPVSCIRTEHNDPNQNSYPDYFIWSPVR